MSIIEHKNKSSILKHKSRYVQGGDTTVYKKKLGWWERNLKIPHDYISDIEVYITTQYANRPDLIAHAYYGDTSLSWIILQYNNIVDITTELSAGKHITIPSRDRVYYDILVNSIKVQENIY